MYTYNNPCLTKPRSKSDFGIFHQGRWESSKNRGWRFAEPFHGAHDASDGMSCCLRALTTGWRYEFEVWPPKDWNNVINNCIFYMHWLMLYVIRHGNTHAHIYIYHMLTIMYSIFMDYCIYVYINQKYHVTPTCIYIFSIYNTFRMNICHTTMSHLEYHIQSISWHLFLTEVHPFFSAKVQRLCQSHLRRSYASSVRRCWCKTTGKKTGSHGLVCKWHTASKKVAEWLNGLAKIIRVKPRI